MKLQDRKLRSQFRSNFGSSLGRVVRLPESTLECGQRSHDWFEDDDRVHISIVKGVGTLMHAIDFSLKYLRAMILEPNCDFMTAP